MEKYEQYHKKLHDEITESLKNLKCNPGIINPSYKDGVNDGYLIVLLKMDKVLKEISEENKNESQEYEDKEL